MDLRRASLLTFAVLVVLVVFSKFSSSDSKAGAYGRDQLARVCDAALRRARFYAEAGEAGEEALAIALLNACSAHAQAQAAKDLAERTGVRLQGDALALVDDAQGRIDELVLLLHGA